jgi:hypothetical protein
VTAAFGEGFTDSKGPRVDKTLQESFQAAREAFVGVLGAQPSIAACLHHEAQGDRGARKTGAGSDRLAGAEGGRSVWVMALFGKGAPPLTLSRRPCGPPQGEGESRRDSFG